ncbi:MAG: arginase family protein [Hyphomicrobium sp.]
MCSAESRRSCPSTKRRAPSSGPFLWEKTVSYGGGTGRGPAAIIDASRNVELFDEELWLDTSRIGIHTLPALDVSLPLESLHHTIYLEAKRLLDSGKFLCSLGGEHALSGPIVKAFSEKFSGLSVLQIDAHADLRDTYDDTPYSHACAMRRALEYCPRGAGWHSIDLRGRDRGAAVAEYQDLLR